MSAAIVRSPFRTSIFVLFGLILHAVCVPRQALAIHIVVDYRYDTNNFFNTQQKRDALEAAAKRYSDIITTQLSAVTLADNSVDPRIGFMHPGTGANFEVSAAASAGSDALIGIGAAAASEYRGNWSIAANDWILYAGGRSLSAGVAGMGNTGTGFNFNSVFADGSSHLNRGFRASGGTTNLPMWGGAVTFDNDGSTTWHYDLNTPASGSETDFYNVALHEIGHVLGLSGGFFEWTHFTSGSQFVGPKAVAAYNADNGTSVTGLNEVNPAAQNYHWQDGTYKSFIFAGGTPNYVGTVGSGVLQDLLMEPSQNYTATVHRFEITNVEVGALKDIGWTVVTPLSGDFNHDGVVDARDYVVWRNTNGTAAANVSKIKDAGSGTAALAVAPAPLPACWPK
jgi:hypothetical protein